MERSILKFNCANCDSLINKKKSPSLKRELACEQGEGEGGREKEKESLLEYTDISIAAGL